MAKKQEGTKELKKIKSMIKDAETKLAMAQVSVKKLEQLKGIPSPSKFIA